MAQALMTTGKAIGIGVGSLSVIVYLALWGGQRQIAYPASFPAGSRTDVPNPYDEYRIDYEDLYLSTPDGEKLHAFLMLQENPRDKKTMFICHANAGNMGHRIPIAAKFYREYGCNVFIYSYRGYGKSTGSPSERGLKIDAETAIQYIFEREELRNSPIILYGQSLGGAVAIYIAERHQDEIDAVVIENTFTDMPTIARNLGIPGLYYLAPLLCTEKWRSIDLMPKLTRLPILFLAGDADEVIPAVHMRQLYSIAQKSSGKVWKSWPGAMHNSTCIQPGYFQKIGSFMAEHVYSTARRTGRVLGNEKQESQEKGESEVKV